jgi:hypothetical protein
VDDVSLARLELPRGDPKAHNETHQRSVTSVSGHRPYASYEGCSTVRPSTQCAVAEMPRSPQIFGAVANHATLNANRGYDAGDNGSHYQPPPSPVACPPSGLSTGRSLAWLIVATYDSRVDSAVAFFLSDQMMAPLT